MRTRYLSAIAEVQGVAATMSRSTDGARRHGDRSFRRLWLTAAALCVIVALTSPSGWAQYEREYLVKGTVQDTNGEPIAGATVEILNVESRRRYDTSSRKNGQYKLIGIPHGVYEVEISKEGYRTAKTEWRYETSQSEMQRVEAPPVVLMSNEQAATVEQHGRMRANLDEATEKLKQNDVDGALAAVEAMLANSPDDANALYIAGLCYLEKDRFDDAIKAFSGTIEARPDFVPALLRLGLAHQRKGEADEAIAAYDRVLELEPESLPVLVNAGTLHYNAQRFADALPYFEKALALNADDANILEMAGYCDLYTGDYASSLEHLEKARTLITDDARAASLDEILPGLRQQVEAEAGRVEE